MHPVRRSPIAAYLGDFENVLRRRWRLLVAISEKNRHWVVDESRGYTLKSWICKEKDKNTNLTSACWKFGFRDIATRRARDPEHSSLSTAEKWKAVGKITKLHARCVKKFWGSVAKALFTRCLSTLYSKDMNLYASLNSNGRPRHTISFSCVQLLSYY